MNTMGKLVSTNNNSIFEARCRTRQQTEANVAPFYGKSTLKAKEVVNEGSVNKAITTNSPTYSLYDNKPKH